MTKIEPTSAGDRAPTIAAAAIAILYVGILWATAPSVGFTRDEGYYFKAAEEYGAWWNTLFSRRFFDAFGDEEIRYRFGYNTEHPALVKLTQGITFRVLHQWLGVATPSQGFRATGFLFAGLSVFATYLLGRQLVSARAGLLAAVLLAAIPRYFYDAHLACFDVPVTAMWTLGLWAFWRAYTAPPHEQLRKSLFAGLIFGLGLATKLNAAFLPFVFVAVWLRSGHIVRDLKVVRAPSGGLDLRLPSIPWVLLACALIGPLVFVAHWPYLWHDTFDRIGAYIQFHLRHEHYPISYFHELLVRPPFPIHFPLVMTALTAPLPLLVLGTFGFAGAVIKAIRGDGGSVLLVVALALPILLIAMPGTPIFGGVKHWYNAMPLLAIAAARTALQGADAIAPRKAVALLIGALMVLPGIAGSAASHPNGIGYYNEIAGGFRGGAEIGMQRGFWGGLALPIYDRLGEMTGGSGRVFFNRTNYDAYRMYLREGLFPPQIHYANEPKGGIRGAVSFEQPEHGEREGEIWSNLGTRPVFGTYQDNVTLTQFYLEGASALGPNPDGHPTPHALGTAP